MYVCVRVGVCVCACVCVSRRYSDSVLHSATPSLSLSDPPEFIKVASAGLSVEVEEGDYDGLVDVMKYLIAVRERQPTTNGMFEPLKQTIELLRSYSQEMSEEVYQQLEVCVCVCGCVPSCDLPLPPPSATARAVDEYEEAGGGDETEREPSASGAEQQHQTQACHLRCAAA